jgi:histidinol-phosphate/aromatic aminotransferase/cobyric acid decarboxylase-like protein
MHHVKYAHLYPPIDYTLLSEKIAYKHNILPENVFIGAGAVSVIYHAVAQFTNEGD